MQIYKLHEARQYMNSTDNDATQACYYLYKKFNGKYSFLKATDGSKEPSNNNVGRLVMCDKDTKANLFVIRTSSDPSGYGLSVAPSGTDVFGEDKTTTETLKSNITKLASKDNSQNQQSDQTQPPVEQSTEQIKNINDQFYNIIKDPNIKLKISRFENGIKSISLEGNNIIIEHKIKEHSILESLQLEIPEFINTKLNESESFVVPDGTVSLNAYLDDNTASILNNSNINVVKIVNNNGQIQFYKNDGSTVDMNALNDEIKKQQNIDNNKELLIPKITKEDAIKLIKAINVNLQNNENIKKLVTSVFGENATIQFTPTGNVEGFKESAIIKYSRLTEDFGNTNNEELNTDSEIYQDISFSLKYKVTFDKDKIVENTSIDYNKFANDLIETICSEYSGHSITGTNNNKIKFTLENDGYDNNINNNEGLLTFTSKLQSVSQSESKELNEEPQQQTQPTNLDKKMQRAQIKQIKANAKLTKSQANLNNAKARAIRKGKSNNNNFWRNEWNAVKKGFGTDAIGSGSRDAKW